MSPSLVPSGARPSCTVHVRWPTGQPSSEDFDISEPVVLDLHGVRREQGQVGKHTGEKPAPFLLRKGLVCNSGSVGCQCRFNVYTLVRYPAGRGNVISGLPGDCCCESGDRVVSGNRPVAAEGERDSGFGE